MYFVYSYYLCVMRYATLCPAELASLLSRNVGYEGPALRKQVTKAQQLQQELSRRELEYQSTAADMRERYYASCKQYGIAVSIHWIYVFSEELEQPWIMG